MAAISRGVSWAILAIGLLGSTSASACLKWTDRFMPTGAVTQEVFKNPISGKSEKAVVLKLPEGICFEADSDYPAAPMTKKVQLAGGGLAKMPFGQVITVDATASPAETAHHFLPIVLTVRSWGKGEADAD